MNERIGRVLEGAALHAAQKSIEATISKVQAKVAERTGLARRVTALEEDVAALKATSTNKRKGA